jgi:N-succinyldiaminopimelate aminotransferase
MRRALVERMAGFGTTIFAEMTALAATTGAINLGQGFPDTDGPSEVIDAVVAAMRAGHNQYPPGNGIPELRAAIAEHQRRCYGLDPDPDTEVLVTTGATEGIAACLLALAGPGDEVLTFEPYYDSYAASIALGGASRRVVRLDPPHFRLDAAAVEAAIGPRTKVLLLNSPHNPTGAVFDRAELEAVADVCRRHDLIAVTDEVYEHLTFDGCEHIPLATLPGMAERTLTISSAGKSFSFTGWKVGWVTGPAELVDAVRTVKQFLTYVSGGPLQYGVATALAMGDEITGPLRASLQAKRDRLCEGLESAGFDVFRPSGTYFVVADIRPVGGVDGHQFCRELPARVGVVGVPTQVFYDDPEAGRHLVRFAFCKRDDVIDEAVVRLSKLTHLPALSETTSSSRSKGDGG